jgi:hypothetical protein
VWSDLAAIRHDRKMHVTGGAYFTETTDGLQPVPEARSPWAADMLHGRLLAGLTARAVERAERDPALRVVRLTLDMFRSPPMSALKVATRIVRAGRRLRVIEVSIRSVDTELARANVLLLRTGPHPPATPWCAPKWDVPLPDALSSPADSDADGGWDIKVMSPGGFWTTYRKRIWARDRWQLVQGEEPSPVVRAALAADLPNPLANSSDAGLQFINADLTLFLARPPVSEWIGLEVADHLGDEGTAIGSCTLYDTSGAIGASTVCAIANTANLAE